MYMYMHVHCTCTVMYICIYTSFIIECLHIRYALSFKTHALTLGTELKSYILPSAQEGKQILMYIHALQQDVVSIINPRRACAARVQ